MFNRKKRRALAGKMQTCDEAGTQGNRSKIPSGFSNFPTLQLFHIFLHNNQMTRQKHSTGSLQWNRCCIFRPAFGCCAPQMLVEIVIFSIFCADKLKNATRPAFWFKLKKPVFLLDFESYFCIFLAFQHKKFWKWLFWPAFGVPSTQTLVEIYNK